MTTCTPRSPRSRRPARNSFQLLWLSRLANSTANTQRRPSQLMPIASSTAWLRITPSSRIFFATRIQHHIRVFFLQPALRKLLQFLIERLIDAADAGGRKLMPAQLFRNRLDLARGNTLHVHFSQRSHQCFFAPLIALEHLRPKAPLAVLGNP